MSAFTDGALVGATVTVALGVLAARTYQAWKERAARRAAEASWDLGEEDVSPAWYVPLLRTPEESMRHFQVVQDAEAVVDAGLDLLGPLYETGAWLRAPAE